MPMRSESRQFDRAIQKAARTAALLIQEYVWLDAAPLITKEAKAAVRQMEAAGEFAEFEMAE